MFDSNGDELAVGREPGPCPRAEHAADRQHENMFSCVTLQMNPQSGTARKSYPRVFAPVRYPVNDEARRLRIAGC
jgi:hypothetical protein